MPRHMFQFEGVLFLIFRRCFCIGQLVISEYLYVMFVIIDPVSCVFNSAAGWQFCLSIFILFFDGPQFIIKKWNIIFQTTPGATKKILTGVQCIFFFQFFSFNNRQVWINNVRNYTLTLFLFDCHITQRNVLEFLLCLYAQWQNSFRLRHHCPEKEKKKGARGGWQTCYWIQFIIIQFFQWPRIIQCIVTYFPFLYIWKNYISCNYWLTIL